MKNAQKKDFLPEEFSVPAATFARNKITLLNLRVPRTEMAFQKPSKPSYQKWQNTVLVERDAEIKNLKMVAKVSPREPLEHMPLSTASIPTAMMALVAKFIVSDDQSNVPVSHNSIERPAKLKTANDRCPPLPHTTTSNGTNWRRKN